MTQLLVAPIEALTDNELTETERRVLLILFSFRGKSTNTVWPSTESIAEMANISDVPRISKITSSLAKKGWLTKKKKGFTGGNEYTLTFPDRLESIANLANFTKMEESANLDERANLEENTNTNLANFTKSNLANSAKYKEQTTEQTIEQKKKNNTKKSDLDFSSWPARASPQVWADYQKLRNTKRAPITQTVITQMGAELAKLAAHGIGVDRAIAVACERGWQGLKCEWVLNHLNDFGGSGPPAQPPPSASRSTKNRSLIEDLTDRSWATTITGGSQ